MLHAYFPGADEPYEKPKKALRAEIGDGGWTTQILQTSGNAAALAMRIPEATQIAKLYADLVGKHLL